MAAVPVAVVEDEKLAAQPDDVGKKVDERVAPHRQIIFDAALSRIRAVSVIRRSDRACDPLQSVAHPPMRVFLTGATGYVGSAVLDAFVRAGHRVTALVRHSSTSSDAPSRPGVEPVVGDLSNPASYIA